MKRLAIILLMGLAWGARAHVGSPNVFFEGQAGPYPIRVILRPPAVLPGLAQVDVRVAGAAKVFLQAALWEAGRDAAPAPVSAEAVAGESSLFHAALWLGQGGSYSVHVAVEGRAGRGTVIVPLHSTATQRPAMPVALGAALAGLGLVLLLGAAWLAGAAARDGSRAPGIAPTARAQSRARIVTVGAAVLLLGGAGAGALRWRTMDGEFRRNALARPVPIAATVRTNGPVSLLQLTPAEDAAPGAGWDTLVSDHGKLMHLFLLREPDFNAFAHLHPVRRSGRSFENVLPPLPAGIYRLYGEVTHENGVNETLTARVTLAAPAGRAPQRAGGTNMLNEVFCQSPVPTAVGNAPQPFALDADDSWHTGAASPVPAGGRVSPLMGGWNMVFQNTGELMANRETSLRFAVFNRAGQPAPLQLYMGMRGHAVVRRADGEVFTHLHPVGTISMAAQEMFARREAGGVATNKPAGPIAAPHEVAFPYAFPRPGPYRVWVQTRLEGRVLTGVFDLRVPPEPR